VLLAGGADGDFHVLTQGGEEFHEASDGEVTSPVAHQQGEQGGEKCLKAVPQGLKPIEASTLCRS
jgi:hypothetical protein